MKREPGNKKLKILIMSAPIGSGHRMAAVALEEALLRLENVEVVQGNVFDFFPSVIGKAFLKFYGTVLKFCPFLYELSYRWSNQGGGSLWMPTRRQRGYSHCTSRSTTRFCGWVS